MEKARPVLASSSFSAHNQPSPNTITQKPQHPEWVQELQKLGCKDRHLLQSEREKSNVNISRLGDLLFTKSFLERKESILDVLRADPAFEKSRNHYLGPTEKLEIALTRGKRLRQLAVEHCWSEDDYQIAADLISEPDPYGLHASLFLVTLREQGSPEQHNKFLAKAECWEYIGCYAQTELGHGSNVRGLESTATWSEEDKTFTLHSPSLTASKWWIGSLGKVANHAIVVAQLLIRDKSYGPHPFIVQVRDLNTHQPLPNIYIGDVGPKFGYNTMDTGFLLFNQFKVPHGNMLSRFSSVNPDTGEYARKGSPASLYATLTYVRSIIVQRAGAALARGVAIATRYCAVRRQFTDNDNPMNGELQVLDYSTVQMRLLPLLATTFALHFTGNGMIELYKSSRTLESNEKLSDLHATSCGLKALASTLAAEGLEACRRACGGHGYSSFSGIGSWYADYLPAMTWEGENYMITQQVARYLLKSAQAMLQGDSPENDTANVLKSFLERKSVNPTPFNIVNGDEEQLVQTFGWRTAHLTFAALRQREEEKRSWNSLLVDFWRLSTAHSEYLVIKYFHSTLFSRHARDIVDDKTLRILKKLFYLFALHKVESRALEFLSTGATDLHQVEIVQHEMIPRLLEEIRPHAVSLVDAWKFPDWQLDSSLGRYDGKVYEDLFRRAITGNSRDEVAFDPDLDGKV